MNIEEFIHFCGDVRKADIESGDAVESKQYFRSVYIGYHYRNIEPPQNDRMVKSAFELGKRLYQKS